MTATSRSVPSTTRRARFKAVSTRHGSGMRPCGCQLDNSSCRREDADISATTRTMTAPPSTAYKIVDVPELQREVIKRYAVPGTFVGASEKESPWVPLRTNAAIRHLAFDVRHNIFSNILWIKSKGVVGTHKHRGTVVMICLEGSTRYLEYDWVATPGAFIYETPGLTHTLVTDDPNGVKLFGWLQGPIEWYDEHGNFVGRLDEVAVLVVPLDRPLEPSEELHAVRIIGHQRIGESRGLVDERPGCRHPLSRIRLGGDTRGVHLRDPGTHPYAVRIIGHQRMGESRGLVDERPGCRHPVVFEIAGAPLETDHDHRAAMLVRADHTLGFDPQDVAEDVVSDVEREVTYGRVGAKRHPRAFLLRGPDEGSRHGVPFDDLPLQLGDIDDLVRRGRRRRHGLWGSKSSHVSSLQSCSVRRNASMRKVDPERGIPHARWIEVAADLARSVVRGPRGDVPVIGQVGSTECRVVYPARRNVVDRRIESARGRPPQHRGVQSVVEHLGRVGEARQQAHLRLIRQGVSVLGSETQLVLRRLRK